MRDFYVDFASRWNRLRSKVTTFHRLICKSLEPCARRRHHRMIWALRCPDCSRNLSVHKGVSSAVNWFKALRRTETLPAQESAKARSRESAIGTLYHSCSSLSPTLLPVPLSPPSRPVSKFVPLGQATFGFSGAENKIQS